MRTVEWFGNRLEGKTVMIESDNMSARTAADQMSSTSADMAELVRRLLDLAVRHKIKVVCTHTPGEKLDRPDRSSRGDPIEEPRARVKVGEYEAIERRHGPFTEFIGPERRYELRTPRNRDEPERERLWLHPSFSTVGSALRLACYRMGQDSTASGIVVVPDHPSAGWASMLKHFSIVGRWPAGGNQLEA